MTPLKEIYDNIRKALAATGKIAHTDLWNHNVEFLEQETAWPLPAVFVEFRPVRWEPLKERCYRGEVEVVAHIVTPWNSPEGEVQVWATADAVAEALDGLSGGRHNPLRLRETQMNHNHEELVETLELFSCRATRTI